uniref:Timeless n=1 Tax=Antheraea pernyi TaxID=7119 RepID=Q9NJQ0_ANTPE|nr:timeless [Antheraea pernyi]
MEWVLRSPQIHSTFSNLGFIHADGYHVNENCNSALETILHNILTEDKYLRTFRRNISFGQNIKKDFIPLLIHAKEDKTIELLIKILVNLTIPIECLLCVEVISKNDFGRHTIFEINNLLSTTKAAFTDHRATKVVIDFLKKNGNCEQKSELSAEQCTNISNSLLLLRNILHIPEDHQNSNYNGSPHVVQNQILWNIFSQSIDKILIKLMTIPDATKWAVTMVQLIALLYKDQHVVTLHKLLNIWLEGSLSESSEDNESNTSPPDRGSDDSSPILTSDPTSDSSDNGGSGKSNDEPNSVNNGWDSSSMNNASENGNQVFHTANEKGVHSVKKNLLKVGTTEESMKIDEEKVDSCREVTNSESTSHDHSHGYTSTKKPNITENSDCGYGTQIENQESISTSSNEDDVPTKKPVHLKPHNPKQRVNNKARSGITPQERKRKKIVKRGKCNIINVQGLTHKTPTDDDISNVLKEFTVDFLLKGYNSLVQTLHTQILTNLQLEIDTSHFFWLVTYFLKFATQIELDLELVCSVLSFDIISYLTAEGVNLCEQFELAIKIDGNDLKPCMRRLHLVVTAIRELIQAIEIYKKFPHLCKEDQETLIKLQIKICETEDLRSLMVLLLRHYNPRYHSKQYLQDLIVTNHNLLTFLDKVMKLPDYRGSTNMVDHLRQFTSPEIMYQYGLLLESFADNGEYVNDCIFTLMYHVGGELDSLISLFQPKILKIFTFIWKSEFEICDDWSDLVEYVINTFIKKPHTLQSVVELQQDNESFDDDKLILKQINATELQSNQLKESWTEDELSSLSWNFMQCGTSLNVIEDIIKLFKEDDIIKSRECVIKELLNQNLINKNEYEKFMKGDNDGNKAVPISKETRDDEVRKLCEEIAKDGKSKFLDWVQKALLDTCFAKICMDKKSQDELPPTNDCKLLDFELFKKKSVEFPPMSPVAYYSLRLNQSVPLVPWNCDQGSFCKDLRFLQLLHKLGFHMPVDSAKIFIRIPNFWTAEHLYEIAGKIAPIDNSTLKFSVSDISDYNWTKAKVHDHFMIPTDFGRDIVMNDTSDNSYQIHKHFSAMVNFTPMPGTSFNSDNNEVNEQSNSWLEVVMKSQEYKITLSRLVEDDNDDDLMKLPVIEKDSITAMITDMEPVAGPSKNSSAPLLMPTVMTTTQDVLPFNNNLAESEFYNNSICETASVASDLTRMYVSDEDEKPDVILRPELEINMDKRCSSPSEDTNVKRFRIDFSPDF